MKTDKLTDIADEIRMRLKTLEPTECILEDESMQHAGYYPGRESHFRVVVVSNGFHGLSRVKQHQMVYQLIAPLLMANGGKVYAIAIHTYTPTQWAKNTNAPSSPACAGRRQEMLP